MQFANVVVFLENASIASIASILLSTNIIKYCKTTDSVIQINQSINLNTLWKENYFDNSTKSFIFNSITTH